MPATASSKDSNGLLNLIKMFSESKDGKAPDLSNMDVLSGALKGEVEIVRAGEQIILPENMTYDEGMMWLMRQKLNEEAEVSINEQIQIMPLDGAAAFAAILKKRFGFVNLKGTPGFFGSRPPAMIGVPTGPGPDDMVQVPWGRFELPGVEGYLNTSATINGDRPVFIISGVVKRKNEKLIAAIAKDVREYLKEHSIYRGKAIKVEFHEADEEDNPFDDKFMPRFLDLDPNGTPVILNADAEARLQVELYQIVENTAMCRKHRVPLKRGVLLEGPYGTGKTLTAFDLAACCVKHGWTYVYVEKAATLQKAIDFAQFYQPCVIFAEDIDKVIDENGDEDLTSLRNALDSIETKNTEIAVVLTTNHIEKLPEGFLRCGRIDSVVTIERPDLESTLKLVQLYGGDSITATPNELREVLQPIVGQSAAVIRECVERAKLAAIGHTTEQDAKLSITAGDIKVTALTMAGHTKLLNRPKAGEEKHPAVLYHEKLVEDLGG
jgi:transitional endoplasmic reticulum ATPase